MFYFKSFPNWCTPLLNPSKPTLFPLAVSVVCEEVEVWKSMNKFILNFMIYWKQNLETTLKKVFIRFKKRFITGEKLFDNNWNFLKEYLWLNIYTKNIKKVSRFFLKPTKTKFCYNNVKLNFIFTTISNDFSCFPCGAENFEEEEGHQIFQTLCRYIN